MQNIENNNQYFTINELKYNSDQLLESYSNNKNEWAVYGTEKTSSLYASYADLDQSLKYIIDQFKNPEIIENIKFLKSIPNGYIPSHIDSRSVALNIPVLIGEDSYMIFYENGISSAKSAASLTVGDKIIKTNAKTITGAKELNRVFIKQATCINTSIPHGSKNNCSLERVILSISFIKEYDSFDIIKKLYYSNNLLKETFC
jgi:hypothetical protein